MPVLTGKELRVVGFLCNWCSYGGADTAGVGRFTQPTDLRIIRVPCSGRVDPLFVVKALLGGADGVLVSGCHPRDCHYSQGNFYARRRLETLKAFLPALGMDPDRFQYTWVSASEGQRWRNVVSAFVEKVHQLGRAPRIEDAVPYLPPAGDIPRAPLPPARRPMAYPATGTLAVSLEALREKIRAALPELECVIGWQRGFDALHATPLFMRTPEDVDRLTWGPLNVHNLATYLPQFKNRKVGVVVKGCDSRSVIELLQEKLVDPHDLRVFGMACEGVVDVPRICAALDAADAVSGGVPDAVTVEGDGLNIGGATPARFTLADVAAEKCRTCDTPVPLLGEVVGGHAPARVETAPGAMPAPESLDALDAMAPEQRRGFWRAQMDRCLRCYACRNACPMCVCRDHCIAETRDPHWTTQEGTVREKVQFQVIHALHLAGRCTECGECQRACPMNIPVLSLKQWLNRSVRSLFDHRAGMDVNAVPPLLSFAAEEKNIKEHGL